MHALFCLFCILCYLFVWCSKLCPKVESVFLSVLEADGGQQVVFSWEEASVWTLSPATVMLTFWKRLSPRSFSLNVSVLLGAQLWASPRCFHLLLDILRPSTLPTLSCGGSSLPSLLWCSLLAISAQTWVFLKNGWASGFTAESLKTKRNTKKFGQDLLEQHLDLRMFSSLLNMPTYTYTCVWMKCFSFILMFTLMLSYLNTHNINTTQQGPGRRQGDGGDRKVEKTRRWRRQEGADKKVEELGGDKQLEGLWSRSEHLWGIRNVRSFRATKQQVQTPPAKTEWATIKNE